MTGQPRTRLCRYCDLPATIHVHATGTNRPTLDIDVCTGHHDRALVATRGYRYRRAETLTADNSPPPVDDGPGTLFDLEPGGAA
jgi:hypothetical protein